LHNNLTDELKLFSWKW